MTLYEITQVNEKYGDLNINYPKIGVKIEMEKGSGEKHQWGENLSLTLIDTIEYCKKFENFFIPSASLLAQIYTHCLNNDQDQNAKLIMKDFNYYWHRTMTIIVFPIDGQKGYVVHYPHSDGKQLVRKDGKLVGDIVVELEDEEVPTFGEIAYFNEHISFFEKVLGFDVAKNLVEKIEEKYEFIPSVWIPPETSIRLCPERLAILGGFTQYGQGIWLTSNSPDQTVVGPRPFRGIYKM